MYMGNINLCTNMHNQITPALCPGGGRGGGLSITAYSGYECGGGGLQLVPVVENNGGFSSRRPRIMTGQE